MSRGGRHSRSRRHRRLHHTHKPSIASRFYSIRNFVRRHPVFSSVTSIIAAIVLVRISLSDTLFGSNVSEFRLWFIFGAIILGIIGLISLKVWFKRKVPQHFTKHDVNWRNR